MNRLLVFKNVTKRIGKRILFSSFSFSFPSKGLFSVVGDSGSGKSTLLEMIAGLDVDYEGDIEYLGKKLKRKSEQERSKYRLKEVGFIRQSYELLVLERAVENVSLPLEASSEEEKRLIDRRSLDLLKEFHLKKKAKAKAKNCSGGEKQRIALARSMVTKRKILLADEPTGALDSKTAEKVYESLRRIASSLLVIMVTHDEKKAKEYSDGIFYLKHQQFHFEPVMRNEKKLIPLTALKIKEEKNPPKVPFRFWLLHSLHLLLARPRRSLLCVAILTMSLFSLGVGTFLSFDASKEMNQAFSSLVGDSYILMEKEGDSRSIEEAYAASEEEVCSLLETYPSIGSQYGVSYYADFSNVFKDLDKVYALSDVYKVELAGFSSALPNDYVYLEETDDLVAYPFLASELEDDQLIIGLPYKNMAQLCFGFQIERNYETLGRFIEEAAVTILFEVANEAWAYSDSQLFTLVGVVESEKPLFYHSSPSWNAYFYETRMRFPTFDGIEATYPWTLQKLYFLRSDLDDASFYELIRKESYFRSFLFERPNYSYNPNLCSPYSRCFLNRYYVYKAKRNSIKTSEIASIMKYDYFSSFRVYGEGSYVAFPNAYMAGFLSPFFLSTSLDSLMEVSEAVSIVPLADKDLAPFLPSDVKEGFYRLPFVSNLTISSSFSSLIKGRKPTKITEVCLSKKLYEELKEPSLVYVSGKVGEEVIGSNLERDYRYGSLKVVGVTEGENDVLHVSPCWSIDYFREELGMSSFSLEPTQVAFEKKEGVDAKKAIAELKRDYPSYHFSDSSSSIEESTESVLSFVRIALFASALSNLLISFLLLVTVGVLFVSENKNEGRYMFRLGISREEIAYSSIVHLLIPIGTSLVLSSLLIGASEYLIHEMIGSSFGGNSLSFRFSFLPLIVATLVCIVSFALLSLVFYVYCERRDYSQEKRG